MKEKVDEFVSAFFPEMQRIQGLSESDTNKLRVSENWLRARLEKLAGDIREDVRRKSKYGNDPSSGLRSIRTSQEATE